MLAKEEIKALSIKKSDLMPPFYGELCLLDSILRYDKDKFFKRIQLVESLYLETYLPDELIQLLMQSGTIKNIMLKPAKGFYSSKELQKISLFKNFKQVNYLEGADTSLAFIEGLQQLEQLDTLVWLDKNLQNPYLGRLSNITTLIIHKYPNQGNYPKWHRFRKYFF